MINLYEMTLSELEVFLISKGFKKFNARQIFEWIYKKKVINFDEMLNLSKILREFLVDSCILSNIEVSTRMISSDGTEKFLLKLEDGNIIESVLMKHNYGNSICVTTQIGCNIGCSFCASGLHKKKRNLKAYEIVLQILKIEEITKQRVSHVVVMGIGEPFDNYDNLMKFIDIVNSPYGLEIGARHITVSTSGIVPKLYDFAAEKKQVNLAISLHASNDRVRSKLMKINNLYNIEELINASKYYIDKTNRRITYEYILLEGINDSIDQADELSDLLRGLNCYVNLIRYNNVEEFEYRGTSQINAEKFHARLLKRGISATLRKEKGSDIEAACGQLRSTKLKGEKLDDK